MSMSNLKVQEYNSVLIVESQLVAKRLGIEHHTFLKTLYKFQSLIEAKFRVVRCQYAPYEFMPELDCLWSQRQGLKQHLIGE